MKVGYYVALARNRRGVKRNTRSGSRINARCVVYKIRVKARFFDLLYSQIPRELINNSTYHFQMPKFFGANIGQKSFKLRIGH